ncbi:hypothetical protein SAMN06296273_0284 [Nitrosomonas ureae]|uniref:Uncharacterized protein n=1 Tax=Nitrosomonas ureae TaxID=44577 RepID=A0A285BUD2_9PROT|nr:hypothetical protein [Nitrosomonas ureae]SNX58819.1 hypothetical protein SAMN06296273_0284 [Nitrosomonas ureae]
MKPFAVILMGTLFLQKNSMATSQEPFDLKNMTCYISIMNTNDCTGIPTLHSGVLTILKEGTFELKAQYEGCFMAEKVTESGKYEVFRFKETMSLELLTTKTMGMKDAIADFPRTLGFANLNYDKLNGYFVDISAVIRGHGRHPENIITSKLQCEVDE